MTPTTDAELMRRARSDPSAFREIYERYAPRIDRYFLRRTRNEDAAHDLMAETFAKAWEARAKFRDEAGGSVGPWVFAIARNVLLNSVRAGAYERSACERLGVLDRVGGPSPDAPEPEERWLDRLDEALEELSPQQREALRLRVEEDLRYDAVADQLGTTPAAARVSVHRGLSNLRTRLVGAEEKS